MRELENLLERAYAFAESDQIEVADLGPLDAGAPGAGLTAPAPTMASPVPATQYAPWGARGMWAPMPPAATPAPAIVPEPAAAPQAAASSTTQPEPAGDATERACRGIVFPIDLTARLEAVERELILQALAQTNFNRTAAAPLLGLNLRQLRYRIQQLGIREAMDVADRGAAENAGDGASEGTP
ncbi:Bacterial regulatory protein, Fis family [compost metagenome]